MFMSWMTITKYLFIYCRALRRLGSLIRKRDRTHECCICQEEYDDDMDDIGVLRTCGHYYHLMCIKSWLNARKGRTMSCPICRCTPTMADVLEVTYLDLNRAVMESRSRCASAISRSKSRCISALSRKVPPPDDIQLPGSVEMVTFASNLSQDGTTIDSSMDSALDGATNLQLPVSPAVTSTCGICNQAYEGDPHQLVVGYLHGCGHVFHLQCIYNKRWSWDRCPNCIADGNTEHSNEQQSSDAHGEGNANHLSDHHIILARLSDLW